MTVGAGPRFVRRAKLAALACDQDWRLSVRSDSPRSGAIGDAGGRDLLVGGTVCPEQNRGPVLFHGVLAGGER